MAVVRAMDSIEAYFDQLDARRDGWVHKSVLAGVGTALARRWSQDQNKQLLATVSKDPRGQIRLPEVGSPLRAAV